MDIRNLFIEKTLDSSRLTKARYYMIKILENHHLTFKELQKELLKFGFNNVTTLYNNIDFLLENKIITELFIDGQTYYDLALDNPNHEADSHIHVIHYTDTDNYYIEEVSEHKIFELIRERPRFQNLDIESIKITITTKKKNKDETKKY
ncbi:MAG: transcriptional repressor [Acholeplasmatales bacterium]|jgi:Fur family ferric uptake transcriptional regulator/Fur family peroxide stress response transcriptional regulator|nr:transcriptional repressor [Acholeplasmatales bacterium]